MSTRRDQDLAQTIAQALVAVLPGLVAQMQQQIPQNQNTGPPANPCTYKHFKSCDPPKFNGEGDAAKLIQWYEGIENTFISSECPDAWKVRHAVGTFEKRALTWWNSEKQLLDEAALLAFTWNDLKVRMNREFCPRNEIKRLEREFDQLKQDSGENLAYTSRFQTLSRMCPTKVSTVEIMIEKYVEGLPPQIRDSVISSRPTTLAEAVSMAALLTDNHVRDGTLKKKGRKKDDTGDSSKSEPKDTTASTSNPNNTKKQNNKKRKANQINYAITPTPVNQQNQPNASLKSNNNTAPLCSTCAYHHDPNSPCRWCTHCSRYGHTLVMCRRAARGQTNPIGVQNTQPRGILNAPRPQFNQPRAQGNQLMGQNLPFVPAYTGANIPFFRACFQCGDPSHFVNVCPVRFNVNNVATNQVNQGNQGGRARVFNANANNANNNINANDVQANTNANGTGVQNNNNVMNGTFLVISIYVLVLFDSGADKSFVSLEIELLLAMPRARLEESLTVKVANGETIRFN